MIAYSQYAQVIHPTNIKLHRDVLLMMILANISGWRICTWMYQKTWDRTRFRNIQHQRGRRYPGPDGHLQWAPLLRRNPQYQPHPGGGSPQDSTDAQGMNLHFYLSLVSLISAGHRETCKQSPQFAWIKYVDECCQFRIRWDLRVSRMCDVTTYSQHWRQSQREEEGCEEGEKQEEKFLLPVCVPADCHGPEVGYCTVLYCTVLYCTVM